jgi:hypothetical protein
MKDKEEIAKENIEKWFLVFKEKLVDDFTEYRITFDYLISEANDNGLLYNMFETSYQELENVATTKGGFDNLILTDYIKSFEYGFNKWIN